MLLILLTVHSSVLADELPGAEVYATSCAACHQPAGEGIPGVFPPLAVHAAELAVAEGGRRHLINALLFGLQGRITVDGETYDGVMPSWFQLSDEEIAAVLTHVTTAWEDDAAEAVEPFLAEEVATARRGALSPQLVWERRPDLGQEAAGAAGEALPEATFTAAQVERARPIYDRLCAECHGGDLTGGLIGGPPLRGTTFLQRWGGRSVEDLFTFTRTQMPQGSARSLPAQQYADLVAMILAANGHDSGDELPGDPAVLGRVGVRNP